MADVGSDTTGVQKTKESEQAATALDKVTDLVEQRELKQADTSRVAGAMKTFAAQQLAEKQAQMKKEKELAAVRVSESDIDIIASEFEIQKRQAERALRENKGDLQATIKQMIRS